MSARRSREDRRKAIQAEADSNRREGGGFGGPTYLVDDDALEKLGVRRYTLDSGEENKGRSHRWSFLQPNPKDPCVTALGMFIHWEVGANNDRFLCPRFMKKEFERLQSAWPDTTFPVPKEIQHGKCPICEERDRAVAEYKGKREGMAEEDRKKWHSSHIYKLQPFNGSFTDPQPNRRIAWIVDEHSDETMDLGAQLVEIAVGGRSNPGVYKGLMDQAVDRETGEVFDVLDDGPDGYIFSFWRAGAGMGTTYTSHKLKPRKGALDEEWLDAVPRFTNVLVFSSYEEIKEAFLGAPQAAEIDADEAPDGPSARRRLREEVDDALDGPKQDEEPRRSRRRGAEAEASPPKGEAAPRRSRRDTDGGESADGEDGLDGGVSPEAVELAKQIRNRRRRRDGPEG